MAYTRPGHLGRRASVRSRRPMTQKSLGSRARWQGGSLGSWSAGASAPGRIPRKPTRWQTKSRSSPRSTERRSRAALPPAGAGQGVLRLGDRVDAEDLPALHGERCASAGGVSLHANVAVPGRDRRRLERLCRYVARPPVATERLSRLADGRLLYRLKHRWRDGTTHVVFEPQELVEKLAALVPPPRFHLVRYHGILGPCARQRDRVVPGGSTPGQRDGLDLDSQPDSLARAAVGTASKFPEPTDASSSPDGPTIRPRRLAWAELLRRVFAVDVLECPRCGGRMRVLAAIHPPDATRAILECLGLNSRAPPTNPPFPEDAGVGPCWEAPFETGV
jgi:hypothetical protein